MSLNLVFEVVGTRTYTTVAGSTNTFFELECVLDLLNGIWLEILSPLEEYKTIALEPSLTEAERNGLEQRKRKIDADSMLSLAKKLVGKKLKSAAKRRLQELVKDYAGTPEAAEAAELPNLLFRECV